MRTRRAPFGSSAREPACLHACVPLRAETRLELLAVDAPECASGSLGLSRRLGSGAREAARYGKCMRIARTLRRSGSIGGISRSCTRARGPAVEPPCVCVGSGGPPRTPDGIPKVCVEARAAGEHGGHLSCDSTSPVGFEPHECPAAIRRRIARTNALGDNIAYQGFNLAGDGAQHPHIGETRAPCTASNVT